MNGLDLALRAAAPVRLEVVLRVAPGEVVALVGRSGAGKTSVLRCIAGLHRGASGHVRVAGETWMDSARGILVPAHRRRVGLLFQAYGLFPHMTALANVMAAGASRAEAQALLAAVHLEGLEDRLPGALSGGQQQRVALARALARRPAVLLLDEPFSAVDRPTRRALAETLLELRASLACPTLLVSHDIADIDRLADRVAVIGDGRVLQDGLLEALRASPAGTEVAALVGR